MIGFLRALPARLLMGLILVYRYSLASIMGQRCRFAPSCSEYGLEAVQRHGAIKGGWLAARRIARCNPWGGSGYDPVPLPLANKPAEHHNCKHQETDKPRGAEA
jgi:putative membrane protein insertion efficiency factor